jgi:hypothetical protein
MGYLIIGSGPRERLLGSIVLDGPSPQWVLPEALEADIDEAIEAAAQTARHQKITLAW